MKQILVSFTLLLSAFNSTAQLDKKTWLVGGNASFRSSKYNEAGGLNSKQTLVNLNGNTGYFILDKLPIGVKPGYSRTVVNDFQKDVTNIYIIGPFVRYYFLQKENSLNVFSELSYQYGITKTNQGVKQNSNNFSGTGGCAVFFNNSVALEFTLGYSTFLYNDNKGKVNSVIAGIGFQFHLTK